MPVKPFEKLIYNGMYHQAGDDYNYIPSNQSMTEGNDDQGVWGMAVMQAAERNFTDPKDHSWLEMTQAIYNTMNSRWDTKHCNGGLRWQIFTWNSGYDYKNSIANGCLFHIAARLARFTDNKTYAKVAEKVWDWMEDVGFATYVDDELVVYDGAKIGDRVDEILRSSDFFFKDGYMFEHTCGGGSLTSMLAPSTKDTIDKWIQKSAQGAAASCSGGSDGITCGADWTKGSWDDLYGLGEQMSALEVMMALLVEPPLSTETGGTSKSNVNAGTDTHDETNKNEITIGSKDKAGAGVLTAIVLAVVTGVTEVLALSIDIDDTDSICEAARDVVIGEFNYYEGTKYGGTVGMFSSPYYWWNAGEAFGGLIDYYTYCDSDNSTLEKLIYNGMYHQAGDDYNYIPSNQSMTEGNDDQGVWGMATMQAVERNFTNPKDHSWLEMTQAIYNTMNARWDTTYCDGGLRWQIFTWNSGYNYKNSIANGCLFHLAARLARYTDNKTYAKVAEKVWNWMEGVGFFEYNNVTFDIYDGAKISNNCSDITKTPSTKDTISTWIDTSAQGAASSCSGGTDGITCGEDWSKGSWDGVYGLGEQMSALEVMMALIVKTPLTADTGGSSKSNVNAGTNTGSEENKNEIKVTSQDKAGAGVLAAVVLLIITGGAIWMLF
ncbi:hypothetical protein QCA50_009461 [Cerrena zonata]|uniref:mannan endo-1,6-alpha-mannosidase n=1 Tax=Cerrena zonata TaxID=2478898 RepID=A0AAW0GCB0_9APHY